MSRQDPTKFPTYVTNSKVQNTFNGGSDTLSGDTKIADNAYLWLINGRCRFGRITPIKKHQQLNAPKGKKQGLFAVGNVLIAFIAGNAFYKIEDDTTWHQISTFSMSPDADRYWMCAVPASTFDFVRKSQSSISDPVKLSVDFKVAGTPAAIVVQDGSSQPYLILYDGVDFFARPAGTFNSWANRSANANDREYVPIGKQMLLFNGNTLFIVSKDGKSVYRSVTGRPLDFMVAVDTNGNKLSSEALGGADAVSFAFDFNTITSLDIVNIPDSFIYSTAYNVRIIIANYDNTIYGEPTFRVSANIRAGVVKEDCILEIVGDYAFIDFEGVIAFNAVAQLKFNGRNSIFSLPLSKMLHEIKQEDPIAIAFDNYAIFNIKSTYGNIMAIYDILLQKWVSYDITDVIHIRQYAIVETLTESQLYCITRDNELFYMFSSPTGSYLTQLHTKSYVAEETDTEHRSQNIRTLFNSGTSDGSVTAIEYVDDKSIADSDGSSVNRVTKPLRSEVSGILYPVRPPVIPNNRIRTDNPVFNFSKGLTGKKLSYIIQWDTDAELIEFQLTTTWKKSTSSMKETNKVMENVYGSNG